MSDFDDFLPPPRHPDSRPQYVSKTNPYSRDDEPHTVLEVEEFFDVVDRRSFAEDEVVRVDEVSIVKGRLVGAGHRLTAAGVPAQRRTLLVPLERSDLPAVVAERIPQ